MVVNVLEKLRQEDSESEASLGYTARPYLKKINSQALVAHACNPNYSGGRDQEDHSSQDPISKKKQHKKGLVDWLQV
jgi:hypothetical protein